MIEGFYFESFQILFFSRNFYVENVFFRFFYFVNIRVHLTYMMSELSKMCFRILFVLFYNYEIYFLL